MGGCAGPETGIVAVIVRIFCIREYLTLGGYCSSGISNDSFAAIVTLLSLELDKWLLGEGVKGVRGTKAGEKGARV